MMFADFQDCCCPVRISLEVLLLQIVHTSLTKPQLGPLYLWLAAPSSRLCITLRVYIVFRLAWRNVTAPPWSTRWHMKSTVPAGLGQFGHISSPARAYFAIMSPAHITLERDPAETASASSHNLRQAMESTIISNRSRSGPSPGYQSLIVAPYRPHAL